MLTKMKLVYQTLQEINNQLEYSRINFLAVSNSHKKIRAIVEMMDLKIERIHSIELETPFPHDFLWWCCPNCGNEGLAHKLIKSPKGRCKCGSFDWKLKKDQKPWLLGTEDWKLKKGEV